MHSLIMLQVKVCTTYTISNMFTKEYNKYNNVCYNTKGIRHIIVGGYVKRTDSALLVIK